jgi:hypothetical protein
MPNEIDAFLGRVFAALPQLRPVYEVVLRDCQALGMPDGAPAELLYEHTVGLTKRLRSDPEAARSELASFAQVLEREYGQSDDVDSLIDGSVLPMLMRDKGGPDVLGVLGPKLAAVVSKERSWRSRPSDAALVRRLVTAVPALQPLADENTYGDHDDVLVHMFLGDVVRREVDNLLQGRVAEVHAVLAVLEAEFIGEAEEPIAVSFVENLPYPHEPGAEIVDLLGPRLRAVLRRQRPFLST